MEVGEIYLVLSSSPREILSCCVGIPIGMVQGNARTSTMYVQYTWGIFDSRCAYVLAIELLLQFNLRPQMPRNMRSSGGNGGQS